MATIECTAGPVTIDIMGNQYVFTPDQFGRYVTTVWVPRHIAVFEAVVAHYRQVNPDNTDPYVPPGAEQLPEPEPEPEPQLKVKKARAEVEPGTESEPQADDETQVIALTEISGIGDALASRLNEAGYFDVRQLAQLNKKEMADLDEQLGLGGRSSRDEWLTQAKKLAR